MRRFLILFALAAVFFTADFAQAVCGSAYPDTLPGGRINVGLSGQNFTVFAAAGFSSTYTDDTFTGPSFVQGNIGVGPGGKFSWSDGTIDGDVYMDGPGGFTMSGPAHFTAGHGVRYNQHAVLDPAYTDYQNLSDAACGETPTSNYTATYTSTGAPAPMFSLSGSSSVNITNDSKSLTITGGPGQKIVLSLQNFVMSAGTFTLQGTATTTFIINIANQFSLNNAKILLVGVPPSNVLFNIRSKNIQISLNQGTEMSGILLALGNKVSLSGGKVFGRVIGGQVNITSGGQVISR